jgi:hypothetical protein
MFKVGDKVRSKKNKEGVYSFMQEYIPQLIEKGEIIDFIGNTSAIAIVRINKKTKFYSHINYLEFATKTCKCCKKDLEYRHFYKDHGRCKECMKIERDAKKVHLCNTCAKEYPVCDGNITEFGNGKGNDNVVKCSGYKKRDLSYFEYFYLVDIILMILIAITIAWLGGMYE